MYLVLELLNIFSLDAIKYIKLEVGGFVVLTLTRQP